MRFSRTAFGVIVAGALCGAPACFLDSGPYEDAAAGDASHTGGTGAAPASGGGGAGGTATTGGAGGATTTTTGTGGAPVTCISKEECADSDPCTLDNCNVDTGTCEHFVEKSSDVDTDPQDCVKYACDANGVGTLVADADDVPDDGNPCTADSCDGPSPAHVNIEGSFVVVGDCGVITCQGGALVEGLHDDQWACIPFDATILDCKAPDCVDNMCTMAEPQAPKYWPCKNNQGVKGCCNGSGNMQNDCDGCP